MEVTVTRKRPVKLMALVPQRSTTSRGGYVSREDNRGNRHSEHEAQQKLQKEPMRSGKD